ncbi:restriction endonuclease subunit S [Sulfurimonas sp. SAG-AH-194-C21]|nr:restriction endonuclease subunit S [Sulfurimonas sp. SAG-AH-194-C21]MDF1883976.1 restriction endonuclease subunit S [Sulfurimonas sp. SAG-AH-194-C21]
MGSGFRDGWEVLEFGDLGKVSMCKRILKKQTSDTGDIPFYKIGTFGKTSNAFISKELYDEYRSKYSFPKKGDILISASGTIGRRVIYNGKPAYFQDSNIVWIDNNEEIVLNKYLYLFYGYCDWNPSKGATISRLYNSDLRAIKISFPKSLEEQEKIVALLDEAFLAIDKAKVNAELNLQNAKELFESYLQGVFENRGEGWEEKSLKDITTKIGSGATPRGGKSSYKEEGLSLVRSMNVHDFEFRMKNLAFIDDVQAEKLSNVSLQKEDILLNITGASIARCCMIPKQYLPARVNQHVSIIRANKEIINPLFLSSLLTSKFYKKQILEIGEQGATRQAITKVQLENFIITFPKTIDGQKQIVKKLNALQDQTKKLESIYTQKLTDLEELKKSILQKAFSGELL